MSESDTQLSWIRLWTLGVVRFRFVVVALWIGVAILAAIGSRGLADRSSGRFSVPGTDTAHAERILAEHFAQKPTGSFILVVRSQGSSSDALATELRRAATRAAAAVPAGRVASVTRDSVNVTSAVVVSELTDERAQAYVQRVRVAAGTIDGATLEVTGQAAIEHDLRPVFARDLRIGELYIAIPIALAILVFIFGTLAFVLPFVFALAAIPTTLGLVWVAAGLMELSSMVENLVTLIGFAIAIDYSLLILYRYREERRAARPREEALVRTMETAGRTILFSGTAVGVGLALLLAMPLPFMRGFGVGGLLIPIVSLLCAFTLLPALLYLLADRLDRVRLVPRRLLARRGDEEHGFWMRLAAAIARRPLTVAVGATVVLLATAAPVFALRVGPESNKGIPQSLASVRGLNILADALGEGALNPTEIVVDTGRPGGDAAAAVHAAERRLVRELEADPEVAAVRTGRSRQYVDASHRYLHLVVPGRHEFGSTQAQAFARRLRAELVPAARFPEGVQVYTGGGPPNAIDLRDRTYGSFPWLVLGVLALTYLLLLRAFRSVLLPLKAIVLNLLSIGAAYGLLVVVFRWGAGTAFGLTQTDHVGTWTPVFLFAMLFGLSMDYEVFLVSRMREEWDASGSNDRAIAAGLARTGRIVTAAALVMAAAFSGFIAGSIVGLQQVGFGLAAAILIDVTLVRGLLLPSVMQLLGRWNWWLPTRVARAARVAPSSPAAAVAGEH